MAAASNPADAPRPPAADLLAHSRALGDPTRHAVFAYLRDAPAPVDVAELTQQFGLNHNAIRQHLAKLVAAGLVISEREAPRGRGRPRWRFRPVPGAGERWGGASPHETLALLLLELVTSGATPREVGRQAGRRLASEHGGADEAVAVLEAVARRLGFEPHRERTASGVDVVLDRCPFAASAAAAPQVVCELHHGIAEGIADARHGEARVSTLVVQPPHVAGCRIVVTLPERRS